MRLKFSGTPVVTVQPIVLQLSHGVAFVPQTYIDLGYNTYDVMCIGGAGGLAGWTWVDGANFPYGGVAYGSGPGGGGVHRTRGLLSALTATVIPSIAGHATEGVAGNFTAAGPNSNPTAGGDGAATTFGSYCRASGGKGGRPSTFSRNAGTNNVTITPGLGGAGGCGGTTTAGGGGASRVDGSWDGVVGKGGGGGTAGSVKASNNTGNPAWITVQISYPGGRGSWSTVDQSVYGPAPVKNYHPEGPTFSGASGYALGHPGSGGGAKAYPLNQQSSAYGMIGETGLIVIRLSLE